MREFLYRLRLVGKDMLQTGPTAVEQAITAEHFSYLKGLHEEGVVIFVGRTLTTDENTMGLAVFRAESEGVAREIMINDPAVKQGLMTATLYPFKVVLQSH